MSRFDLKSILERMFPVALEPSAVPIHNRETHRRCPECAAAYEPARHRYCPQCTLAVPEWRYG